MEEEAEGPPSPHVRFMAFGMVMFISGALCTLATVSPEGMFTRADPRPALDCTHVEERVRRAERDDAMRLEFLLEEESHQCRLSLQEAELRLVRIENGLPPPRDIGRNFLAWCAMTCVESGGIFFQERCEPPAGGRLLGSCTVVENGNW